MPKQIDFGFRVARIARRLRQAVDAELRVLGLTEATWRPLAYVGRLGEGVRQRELAAALGIEGPSLVRLLDNLERRGLIERREHEFGVAAAERHDVNGGEFQVRRHSHLGNGDDVAFKIGIVDATLRQNIGDRVTHGLADAQLTLRAAGGGTFLVMAGHCGLSKPRCPRLSRAIHVISGESIKARMAGTSPAMTLHFQSIKKTALRKTWTYRERWIVSTR